MSKGAVKCVSVKCVSYTLDVSYLLVCFKKRVLLFLCTVDRVSVTCSGSLHLFFVVFIVAQIFMCIINLIFIYLVMNIYVRICFLFVRSQWKHKKSEIFVFINYFAFNIFLSYVCVYIYIY